MLLLIKFWILFVSALLFNLSPLAKLPLPARFPRLEPLLPIPLQPDVQNGITFLPSKLYFSTNVAIILGASPHHIGYPR